MITRAVSLLWLLACCAELAVSAPPDPSAREPTAAGASRVSSYGGSPGKPTGPIGVAFELRAEPAVGQSLEIELRVGSQTPLTDARVSLRPSEGLRLDAPGATALLTNVDATAGAVLTVTVTPLVEDVLYLTVVVEGVAGGAPQARSLMIPVRLATAKTRVPPLLKREPDGRLIRPLPTVETRR